MEKTQKGENSRKINYVKYNYIYSLRVVNYPPLIEVGASQFYTAPTGTAP
jgi:hypothetical protein